MHFGVLVLSLWWYLPLVAAEGDPIPQEVYKKLRGSSVHSIADLQHLLQIDSVEDKGDYLDTDQNSMKSVSSHNATVSRVRRSLLLAAQPAEIAECKPRTEVFEIFRSLVDPSNTNFLVWPPCVEVQRCSGCCSTKAMHCTPSRVHLRYVQVNKIKIVRKKPIFHKVIVTLEDHLECRCESVAVNPPPGQHAMAKSHEARGHSPGIASHRSRVTATPVSWKEQATLRPPRRKHRKMKHVSDKKILKELLNT